MSEARHGFQSLQLRGRYRGFEDRVNDFYLPVLGKAVRYDRLVGYWRSSSLIVAATGIARFARSARHDAGDRRSGIDRGRY